jgi:GNAT superfamily N-acetyltransferase
VDGDAPVVHMDVSETDEVRALLRAYAESLPFELDFQGFQRELAELPGAYAPPRGALLVAHGTGGVTGCVALRPLADDVCEMKRLFVLPAARGTGLGRRLATAVVDEARRLGYARMRLDTTPGMAVAQALYDELGFTDIAPYRHNPVTGTRFLELQL